MKFKEYAFSNLPFSPLFQRYISNFDALRDYFSINPFEDQQVIEFASAKSFTGSRDTLRDVLFSYNACFDLAQPAIENIARLSRDNALAVVTGQQLGLMGGPLYTMFKIIRAIHLAQHYQQALNRPVIPVFWLADEDHDYDEIRSVTLPVDDGITSFSLPARNGSLPPVADMKYPAEIEQLKQTIRSSLPKTDFSDDLWALVDDCFSSGMRFEQGFGLFISQLFSTHGLVLAGSNHKGAKKAAAPVMQRAVSHADELRTALEQQSTRLSNEFHQQVKLYDSHLFYIDDAGNRQKISRDGDTWMVDANTKWSSQELTSAIGQHPAQFSPDVFLRPIIQDSLLPTLGYVAGPGETAYYAQMKHFYEGFDLSMPAIFPRLSGTFVEPAIVRIFNELPFSIAEYNNRIEDLETAYVKRSQTTDFEALFSQWKADVDAAAEPHQQKVSEVDETLQGAAEKVRAHYFNALDDLKSKVYRASKKNDAIQINRINRIHRHLFPGRSMQERTICGLYYMNKFGLDVWDRLLEAIPANEPADTHKLLYL